MRDHTLGEHRRLYVSARTIVANHYRRPLTLAMLARVLCSSPRQLQRVYARFGDITFQEDLLGRRMSAAAELLAEQAIPIGDVARLVGYRQPSHFSQAFRRRYGCSPQCFRMQARSARVSRSKGSPSLGSSRGTQGERQGIQRSA
ncbi:MAG TPA: helix-turn-helix transcriptional regulator [Solirubrobacteraceae bacterium]|nr:helix-turn-helix transcriptional regulator [Solirubrobacteraceae bacterium]